MHGVGARLARGANVLGRIEVRRDLDERVRGLGMEPTEVVGRRDGDRFQSFGTARAEDAQGDLAAVGYEHSAHGDGVYAGAVATDSCRAPTVPGDEAKIAAVIAVLVAAGAGSARAATTLIVTGHGWGHGVGMSQWGAYGFARHGWGYRRILFHYYPGTSLKKGGEPNVRVLLLQGAPNAKIGCATQITVTDGRRFTRHLPAKAYNVGPRFLLPVRHAKGVRPFARGFADFSCERAALTLGGRPYRGDLVVRRSGATISVINALDLDDYVRGVVPSESPARWPLAELEAQAVAARSYALFS